MACIFTYFTYILHVCHLFYFMTIFSSYFLFYFIFSKHSYLIFFLFFFCFWHILYPNTSKSPVKFSGLCQLEENELKFIEMKFLLQPIKMKSKYIYSREAKERVEDLNMLRNDKFSRVEFFWKFCRFYNAKKGNYIKYLYSCYIKVTIFEYFYN